MHITTTTDLTPTYTAEQIEHTHTHTHTLTHTHACAHPDQYRNQISFILRSKCATLHVMHRALIFFFFFKSSLVEIKSPPQAVRAAKEIRETPEMSCTHFTKYS